MVSCENTIVPNRTRIANPISPRGAAIVAAVACSLLLPACRATGVEPVDLIDPLIGTITLRTPDDFYGLGKTFPGATTPFGMVQISPDTITGGDNAPGYSYLHNTIEGFSLVHLSGTGWYGEFGNFLVMPTTGPLQPNRDLAKSEFSHDNETARAGYYSVLLDRYQTQVELTATQRTGFYRFTFPDGEAPRVQVDLARRIGMKSRWLEHSRQRVEFVGDRAVRGWMDCPHTDGGWGQGAGGVSYQLYYYAEFSRAPKSVGVWDREEVHREVREYEGTNSGLFVEFAPDESPELLMKVGLSFVDADGAKANLLAENPGWDFDEVARNARQSWADALSLVEFQGGSERDRIIMATALYHAFMDPRSIVDVDGRHRGADGVLRTAQGFRFRTVFSGWDAFRSHFPLLTLIRPDIINDIINSWDELATATGNNYLPRWEIMHSYSGCMLGNPAVSVVLDAYTKGIRGFDIERAYGLCVGSVEKFGNHPRGFTPNGLSHTVEYAYTDWCAGRLAEMLGKEADAKTYFERSKAYRNLWDDEAGWFRGKDEQGRPLPWYGKEEYGQGCVECNPYQQGWFAPHDVAGLMAVMGREAFDDELEAFFDGAPDDLQWNNFYNHPNEPCHHVAFLFNYGGKPWLTQKWTRRICDIAYGLGPRGLGGNEDLGQMSAWYVLAAIGIHPVCPGDGVYQITSPVFDEATIKLSPDYYPGGRFTIRAENNSEENLYIQSATLNGKEHTRCWLEHSQIVAGGELVLQMGPEPNRDWGTPPPLSNLPDSD